MNFLEELQWRGLVHDNTPELNEALEKGMLTGYIGFDPTAKSLHIGNLIPITLLLHLQRHGHRPIALVGGATGRIGDPSGKDKERTLLSLEKLEANVAHCAQQMSKFLDFENGENKALLVNNYDFYKDMGALEFLRDVGKHITVNYMMSKDSVKNRIGTGISFTEFSYQLIQGYDFKCLNEQYDCTLQMGGSDQWGNITTGVEFVRRMRGNKAHALTTPLLTKPDGSKYGKSEGGNIWLDPEMTSPYEFYQFFFNSRDDMMERLLKTFSLKNEEEIKAILAQHKEAEYLRFAQKTLAEELTTRVHSKEACEMAISASEFSFDRKMNKTKLGNTPESVLEIISKELDSFTIPTDQVKDGMNLIDLISGDIFPEITIVSSKGDARRALKNNALAINYEKVKSADTVVNKSDFNYGKYLMLENGKKNKYVVIAG